MYKNIEEMVQDATQTPPLKMVVAVAEDSVVLKSIKIAEEKGIIQPVLIGNEEKIKQILQDINYDFSGKIINETDHENAAHKSMQLIAAGEADFPMKGLLSSSIILKAMLDKEHGLRKRLLSLVTLINLKDEDRMIYITDGGVNIAPDLEQKVEIINNAIELARITGIKIPRVAPIAAIENVNSAMPVTMDAALLSKMADRGQIKNAIVDGPLALDNAISLEAAVHKGIKSPVAGKADILLLPDIEACNVLYKAMVFYFQMDAASVVLGGRVPLVLTSRADSVKTKFYSIALNKIICERGV